MNPKLPELRPKARARKVSFTKEITYPADITGWTLYVTVKSKVNYNPTDSDAAITKDITSHNDAVGGETSVTFSDADMDLAPGEYIADYMFNTGSNTIYIVREKWFIEQKVTNRN